MVDEQMTPMSVAEALERWPFDEYEWNTLGGMQRDIVIRFWEALEEMPAVARPGVMETFGRQIAEDQARIDEMHEEGLRAAFSVLMGYELP